MSYRLPPELLLEIADKIPQGVEGSSTLASFSRSSRTAYELLNPLLYRRAAEHHPGLLFWAAYHGRLETMRKLLAGGADPNVVMERGFGETMATFEARMFGLRPAQQFQRLYQVEIPGKGGGDTEEVEEVEFEIIEMSGGAHNDSWILMEVTQDNDNAAAPGEEPDEITIDLTSRMDLDDDIASSMSNSNEGRSCTVVPLRADHDPRTTHPGAWTHPFWTPLHLAVLSGSTDAVDLLLGTGAVIDAPAWRLCACDAVDPEPWSRDSDDAGLLWTPLHTALCAGRDAIARLLVHRGASAVVSRDAPVTALHSAAALGRADMVAWLVEACGLPATGAGFRPDDRGGAAAATDDDTPSPLWHAYLRGHWAAVDALVARGADIDDDAARGYTPLIDACAYARWADALALLERGADPAVLCTAYPGYDAAEDNSTTATPTADAAASWLFPDTQEEWAILHTAATSRRDGRVGLTAMDICRWRLTGGTDRRGGSGSRAAGRRRDGAACVNAAISPERLSADDRAKTRVFKKLMSAQKLFEAPPPTTVAFRSPFVLVAGSAMVSPHAMSPGLMMSPA